MRNRNRLRSKLSGTLALFDKHWNLVLSDVDEVESNIRLPIPSHGIRTFRSTTDPRRWLYSGRIDWRSIRLHLRRNSSTPHLTTTTADRSRLSHGTNYARGVNRSQNVGGLLLLGGCFLDRSRVLSFGFILLDSIPLDSRHIPQLFVRGDNVILVSVKKP